jgi:two-component system, NarL family, response regulator NreC
MNDRGLLTRSQLAASDDAATCARSGRHSRTFMDVAESDSTESSSADGRGAPAGESIRIVIADDHVVVRSGLRMLLDGQSDFEVVAEAGDVESAANLARDHRPTVLVLDLNMPGGPSLEAIPHIRKESPETRVVVLTMEREPAFAREALGRGASGYVLKESADHELVEAVRRAAAGESYLTPSVGARIAAQPRPGRPDNLSVRETEVLTLIALGHTAAEIAELLVLSERTIESHRKHIQEKLLLNSRAELVGYAREHGLVSPKVKPRE